MMRIRLRAFSAPAKLAVCAAVLFTTAMTAAMAGQEKKSVKAGVYTVAQAGRGEETFKTACSSCHAPGYFTDKDFYANFAGKPLWELFDVISDSMPMDNPGSLKKEQYADVIAYVLKLNKFPDGAAELPIDKEALSAIMMEKP